MKYILIALGVLLFIVICVLLLRIYARFANNLIKLQVYVKQDAFQFVRTRNYLAKSSPGNQELCRMTVADILGGNSIIEDYRLNDKVSFHSKRLRSKISDTEILVQAAHLCALCRINAELVGILSGAKLDFVLIALMERMIAKNIHVLK